MPYKPDKPKQQTKVSKHNAYEDKSEVISINENSMEREDPGIA